MYNDSWRKLKPEELEIAYNPQKSVKNFADFQKHRNDASKKFRDINNMHLDISYGSHDQKKVDIFLSEKNSPVHIFFHGGYWRTQDKKNFAFIAETLNKYRITVVIANYVLCPKHTLSQVVQSAREVIIWTYNSINKYSANNKNISISGNSAGAHLCSMLISTDWKLYGLPNDCIKAATLISGIYDPEPTRWIKVNNEIGIDLDEASLNNSISLPPFVKCPVWLGAGGREPWPWIDQTLDYSQYLRKNNFDPELHILPNHNHFSIMDEIYQEDGILSSAIVKNIEF